MKKRIQYRKKVSAIISLPSDRDDRLVIMFFRNGDLINHDILSKLQTEIYSTKRVRHHLKYKQYIIEELSIVYTDLKWKDIISDLPNNNKS